MKLHELYILIHAVSQSRCQCIQKLKTAKFVSYHNSQEESMMTQYTPAAAWEDYINRVWVVCRNEADNFRSLLQQIKYHGRPDDDRAAGVGSWFIDRAIRESSVSAARERARRAFCEHGLGALFDEKNDLLESEVREWGKKTSRNCWRLQEE